MNFLKKLFSVKPQDVSKVEMSSSSAPEKLFSEKPQDVDEVAMSYLSAPEKLTKLLKFTDHHNAEVRLAAIRWLGPTSQDIHDNSEEQIITRLSELAIADPDQKIKTEACNKIIDLIRNSQSFGFVSDKYPMAVQAVISQLKSSTEAADSTINSLSLGRPKFHRMFSLSSYSDELISALGQYAQNRQNSNGNRNGATIILGHLKDLRAKDFLQNLTDDNDIYIQANARQSLQQIEPVEEFFSFSLDGWKIERYTGSKMIDFAKITAISGEKNLKLIYAFILIPDKNTRGNWGVLGGLPCPNCGGNIAFELGKILNPKEQTAKGSCYPNQDYSIVVKYRKTENNGIINIPVLIFTDNARLSHDYLLNFAYFQKYT